MALTSRRKRPLDRTIPHLRDTRLFIVATEGEKTEKQYFEMFRSSKIQVKVIPTESGQSSPDYVLKRLVQYCQDFQIGKDDELWFVSDVDRWRDEKLSQICQMASQKGFEVAISNPCFEVWLILHFVELPTHFDKCSQVVDFLRNQLGGYSKNIQPDRFHPYIPDAVERAKRLHTNPGERWPTQTGSHVYKLVEKLIVL